MASVYFLSISSQIPASFDSAVVKAPVLGLFLRLLRERKLSNLLLKIRFEPAGCYISATMLQKIIGQCKNVKEVDLSGCDIDCYLLDSYCRVISENDSQVEIIRFAGNDQLVSSDIAKFIESCRKVKTIDCTRCIRIPDASQLNLNERDVTVLVGGWGACPFE